MKHLKKLSFGVLVAAFLLVVTPAFAQISPYGAAGTATSTNSIITYSPANPRVVQVFNDGASPLFLSFNAVATASPGANVIRVNACEVYTFYAPSNATTLGLITSGSATTAYRVAAFYQPVSSASSAVVGVRVNEQAGYAVNSSCTSDALSALSTANGASMTPYSDSELITLDTGGATTDSAGDLLHANSIIDAVVCRVTTTITVATDWGISDPTTALRFSAVNATMTAGATTVGLKHMFGVVSTTATGPTQASAAKLRITTTGTPGAGVVRCTVFGRTASAPTS